MKGIFGKNISENGHEIYDYLKSLHEIVESGDNGFGITGFVESVFYSNEKKLFKKYKINNLNMVRLLYQLFYFTSENRNYQIPYNLITPRQLGSIDLTGQT